MHWTQEIENFIANKYGYISSISIETDDSLLIQIYDGLLSPDELSEIKQIAKKVAPAWISKIRIGIICSKGGM